MAECTEIIISNVKLMNMKSNNVQVASQDEQRSVSDIINLIYTNLSATIITVD